ncbi:MAG: hypothetical protein JW814_07220 [Candidatus Krumholzibacteriota bacterium]|nr:hypothetical protein [Candidatus Krumholzibacteriota bacterium]
MTDGKENKIVARGLKAPAALLLVKKNISGRQSGMLRIIVSFSDAVEALKDYFSDRGVNTEIDIAGDDYHLLVDMKNFKDVD